MKGWIITTNFPKLMVLCLVLFIVLGWTTSTGQNMLRVDMFGMLLLQHVFSQIFQIRRIDDD